MEEEEEEEAIEVVECRKLGRRRRRMERGRLRAWDVIWCPHKVLVFLQDRKKDASRISAGVG